MKSSREMAIYRKLLLDYEPIDKYASEEKRYKDLISQCILSIYNNVIKSSENLNNIVNGCAYSMLIDEEAYRTANLNIRRSEIEEAVKKDKRYLELVNYYSELGYKVVILSVDMKGKVFFLHIQDVDYLEWLKTAELSLELLVL